MTEVARSPAARDAERLFVEHLEHGEADVESLCRAHPEVAAELRDLAASWELATRLRGPALSSAPEASGPPPELVARLAARGGAPDRYHDEGEIARGAQGAVRRAFDSDLQRHVAMKVLHEAPGAGSQLPGRARRLGRFLDEAQVTAQLEHPAIVPVHELGLDDLGRVYFTMKLVRGRSLQQVLDARSAAPDEEWTTTRILGALLRVAEAMAFAHDRGVVHRDLKPANIMLGGYGEVYVMDWGLARVLHAPDVRPADPVRSHRAASDAPASALHTLEGDVLGTPHYMAPEQADGRLALVGPAADVYALGAMLYHVLAGCAPWADVATQPADVLARVRSGPPAPLRSLAPDTPPELEAICEKAMARQAARRYASMADAASDLRAFLERRVVRAYETGALAELRKWVRRNRALTAASLAVLVALVGGQGYASYVDRAGRRLAEGESRRADASLADLRRLSDAKRLQDLQARADSLWPALPELAPALRDWMDDAHELLARTDQHRATLAELRARALPGSPADSITFAETEDAWWHGVLASLVTNLDAFAAGTVADVERRLRRAETIEHDTVDAHRAEWDAAIASIADPSQCPAYRGLRLAPQVGLVPLERDADSGLWEFADVQLGATPARAPDGRLLFDDATGVVFVLLPGGTFLFGAQSEDPAAPNYDASVDPALNRIQRVRLDPFYLARHELTQAQWERGAGRNPSMLRPDWHEEGRPLTPSAPVEYVNHEEAAAFLAQHGFILPTEAQWEYACRGGTTTAWWTGAERQSLAGAGNLADRTLATHSTRPFPVESWLEDGWGVHGPVGLYRANPFGLYDMTGNVAEWTREPCDAPPRDASDGEGLQRPSTSVLGCARGGSWSDDATRAGSGRREWFPITHRTDGVGVRAARGVR